MVDSPGLRPASESEPRVEDVSRSIQSQGKYRNNRQSRSQSLSIPSFTSRFDDTVSFHMREKCQKCLLESSGPFRDAFVRHSPSLGNPFLKDTSLLGCGKATEDRQSGNAHIESQLSSLRQCQQRVDGTYRRTPRRG